MSQDLRETEHANPRTVDIDIATPLEIVDLLSAEDRTVADAVARQREQIAAMIDIVESALRRQQRLIYLGAGTSGRLGVLDASEIPPTFGERAGRVVGLIAGGDIALREAVEGAEDRPDAGRADLVRIQLQPGDVVIGIAASGNTPYVRAGLHFAKSIGARTGLITCATPLAPMRETAEVLIHLDVGPEAVTGSTRMKAGTATKMALNMITTGAMIRVGKIYRNLMVDLTATNVKLVDRSERIFMEVRGTDRATARTMIDRANGSVKLALVMHARGVELAEAEELLQRKQGLVRGVIGPLPDFFK